MYKEYTDIDIESITVKRPLRKEHGNIDSLTASIRKQGLLCPILVDRNNILVAGGRRLEACRRAGLTSLPAIRVDTEYKSLEALAIQTDENLCRLPLAVDELEDLIQLKTSAVGSGKRGLLTGLKHLLHHD